MFAEIGRSSELSQATAAANAAAVQILSQTAGDVTVLPVNSQPDIADSDVATVLAHPDTTESDVAEQGNGLSGNHITPTVELHGNARPNNSAIVPEDTALTIGSAQTGIPVLHFERIGQLTYVQA